MPSLYRNEATLGKALTGRNQLDYSKRRAALGDDGVAYENPYDVYERYGWPVPPFTLALNRYERGTLAFYLPVIWHSVHAFGEKPSPQEFIVVYHPRGELSAELPSRCWIDEKYVILKRPGGGEVEFPVLISIDKFVQNPQGMHLEPLPFLVRLDKIDQRLGGFANTWADGDGAGRALRKDGELGPRAVNAWLPSVELDEFPSQVIKARSQVVDDIPQDRRSSEWWVLSDRPTDGDDACARFVMSDQFVRLTYQVPPDLGVEFGQVFLGPVQLRQGCTEVSGPPKKHSGLTT